MVIRWKAHQPLVRALISLVVVSRHSFTVPSLEKGKGNQGAKASDRGVNLTSRGLAMFHGRRPLGMINDSNDIYLLTSEP